MSHHCVTEVKGEVLSKFCYHMEVKVPKTTCDSNILIIIWKRFVLRLFRHDNLQISMRKLQNFNMKSLLQLFILQQFNSKA